MKTTIDIPDDLYRRVKAEAAMRGLTVREATIDLYRRWLREGREPVGQERPSASEWLVGWFSAADEAMEEAPPGPSAREDLSADRMRSDRR